MGRRIGWLSKVKKALSHDSKAKKAEKAKKKWHGKGDPSVTTDPLTEVSHPPPLVPPVIEEVKLIELENEQTNQASSVSVATAEAVDVAASASEVATVASQQVTSAQLTGKSKEEVAAIRIQAAFRSYKARKGLRSLRGLARVKSFVDGPIVKRQTSSTLKSMQALSRVQSQILSTRIRMLEENRAIQKQLLQKRAQELETLKIGEDWDDTLRSKEKIEENLLQKYEAAVRRERALAYSYTHQQTWKKCPRPINLLFIDPTNPQWGWSWLERWMVPNSSEATKSTAEKDLNGDAPSTETMSSVEITKSFARHQLNSEKNPSSPARQKLPSSAHLSPANSSSKMAARRIKNGSPKQGLANQDDDSKSSTLSVQSDRNRRNTITGSSMDDAESMGSSPSVPSYMASTHSAKAKLKLPSPLGVENRRPSEKPLTVPKKRLSFPPSPSRHRKVEA